VAANAEREPGTSLPALGSRGQGWVAGQMLLIFLEGVVSYPSFDALPPTSPAGWLSMGAGAVLFVAGLWVAYRGIDALGPHLTALPAPAERGELVVTGIYRRVRHPIYAGVIAVALGWAFFVVSPAALVVALALAGWLDLKSRREEVWLLDRYPGYAAYRRGTARFVPGIY
jgi:protein-S-isoprenylcysteine O-methyltransferase Ste14